MNFNKTFVFTSVGFIILFIIYNNKRSPRTLNSFKSDKNNPSVLDDILFSEHKYEISDCTMKTFHCNTDEECQSVCNHNLPWICSIGQCNVNTGGTPKPNCLFGNLRVTHDDNENKFKFQCVCDLFYWGVDCSKTVKFCNSVEEGKCLCDKDNVLFKYFNDYNVCIPKKHFILFSSQDHFQRIWR